MSEWNNLLIWRHLWRRDNKAITEALDVHLREQDRLLEESEREFRTQVRNMTKAQRAEVIKRLEDLQTQHRKMIEGMYHSVEVDLARYMRAPEPKIALPPGYWMQRVAGALFFFSPKTIEHVFCEIIGAYQRDMIKAEAAGESRLRLFSLQVQYWGGFVWSIFDEIAFGFVGKIVRAFKGG